MTGGGGGGGSQNTVTQTQAIPDWQKDFVIQNEQIAAGLGARPYEPYQGQLVAGLTPDQQTGIQMANQAATSYQPQMNQAIQQTQDAAGAWQPNINSANALTYMGAGAGQGALGAAQGYTQQGATTWGQASPQQQQAYMDPYVMQALAPQLAQLDIQRGQNQLAINKNASQAGAFGDARNGVESALNNFYGDITKQGVIGQGLSNAYNTGMQAFNQGQQQQLAAGSQMGNLAQQQQNMYLQPAQQLANLAGAQQSLQLTPAQQLAQLGGQNQNLGLQGATAVFNSGTQQQQLNQQQLTTAYQNWLNQQNWPTEQLNMRIAAAANSPYSVMNQTQLAPNSATAMNIGAFGALAGGIGSLLGGGSSKGGLYGGGA